METVRRDPYESTGPSPPAARRFLIIEEGGGFVYGVAAQSRRRATAGVARRALSSCSSQSPGAAPSTNAFKTLVAQASRLCVDCPHRRDACATRVFRPPLTG